MADDTTRDEGGPEEGPPKCPQCHRPLDDIETMGEAELLEAIHIGLLRDLARSVRSGEANHQQLAIARGLLRDNKKVVPPEEPLDEALPAHGRQDLPKRDFPTFTHDE